MRKSHVVVIAALVLALLSAPAMFWATRPAPGMLYLVRASRAGDRAVVTFAINETRHFFSNRELSPVRLERMEGGVWREYQDGVCGLSDRFYAKRLTCMIKRLRGPLRLVAHSKTELKGLDTFIPRLKLRLFRGSSNVSLDPFDTKFVIVKDSEMASQPFLIEP